ncbi:MAG: thiaminase II [Bacteroidota bacterium]
MSFINELWKSSEEIYQSIITHPFNQELAEGTLKQEKFNFYLSQDAIYIGEYSRALAALATKSPTHEEMMEFISFAKEGLEIERELHDHFMKAFQVKKAEEPALATEAYSNFLLSSVAFKSYEEALAALLPCFWLYNEVALSIRKNAVSKNPYQKWIDTYSGAEFDQTTERLKEITNQLALDAGDKIKKRMKQQFIKSARYEWLFWNNAYQLKFWE